MATKTYWLKFGSGDPRPYTGLTPTFLQFFDNTGQTLSPPSIAEVKYGGATASGMYGFSYNISSTQSICFLAFSVTLLANTNDRYVSGILDPVQAVDQPVVATGITISGMAATLLALGSSSSIANSFIGSTASSIGSTSVDPTTVFGFLKRMTEFLEGDNVFYAAGGTWLIYNRASLGSTTLLRVKTILNSGAGVTKT